MNVAITMLDKMMTGLDRTGSLEDDGRDRLDAEVAFVIGATGGCDS